MHICSCFFVLYRCVFHLYYCFLDTNKDHLFYSVVQTHTEIMETPIKNYVLPTYDSTPAKTSLSALVCIKPSAGVCFVCVGRLVDTYCEPPCRSIHILLIVSFRNNSILNAGPLFPYNTMGSNWIDLKCSSQYVLTSLPPHTTNTNRRYGTA